MKSGRSNVIWGGVSEVVQVVRWWVVGSEVGASKSDGWHDTSF